MRILGYAYDADHHCEPCTLKQFQRDEYGDIQGTDSEGNEIHPIFSTDEWYNIGEGNQTLNCSDCGEELDAYHEDSD